MPGHDYFGRQGLFPYDPRYRPIAPPETGIFDSPLVQICINERWVGHLDGVISRLLWLDAWAGTQDVQEFAVAEITKLLVQMTKRTECVEEMDVRTSPDDCKVLEKFVGGEWVVFADFNGCIVGEPGEPGEPGAPGAPGAPGTPGAPGAGGNEYPPLPTSAQPDQLCNAANYIVQKVRDVIVDVYAQLATLEPSEVLSALLGQGGWSVEALIELIGYAAGSLENEIENLAAYDAAHDDLVCELISFELDKAAFEDWIETNYASEPALRDMILFGIQSAAANGQYALWAAVGSTMTGATCDCEEDELCPEIDWVFYPVFLADDSDQIPTAECVEGRWTITAHPSQGRIFFRLPNGRKGNFTNLTFDPGVPDFRWCYAVGTTSTGGGANYATGLDTFENPGTEVMGYGLNGITSFSFDFEETT